jgi:hypothetical protein
VNNYQIILYILYWHKCQCWQVAQHECKFRICSIRCLESCKLDMPINCLRKMEKATSSVNTLTAAFSKSCLVTVFICLTLFCHGALLSRRSFVAALILRLSFVARSNVVDSCKDTNKPKCLLMTFRKYYEIFLFLIGEKLTKINLIHMCMFHLDDRSIMGIFLIDSSTSCSCLI